MRNLCDRVLRTLPAVVASLLAMAVQSAQAQSRMPFGLWQGERSGATIQINRDMTCSASGRVNVAGPCEWLSTRTGGQLNIYHRMLFEHRRVGWSVLRLDGKTLLLDGAERYFRRG
jgi:hypothetical protein